MGAQASTSQGLHICSRVAAPSVLRSSLLRLPLSPGLPAGAAFDVPMDLGREIMARVDELHKRGVSLTVPESLPAEEDLYQMGRYGSRGGRGCAPGWTAAVLGGGGAGWGVGRGKEAAAALRRAVCSWRSGCTCLQGVILTFLACPRAPPAAAATTQASLSAGV